MLNVHLAHVAAPVIFASSASDIEPSRVKMDRLSSVFNFMVCAG
jgi:hypothetical protein